MPAASITQEMPCSSAEVFALLHDYSRRLEWDTLLCEARLTRGCTVAEKGATSFCKGKHLGGCIGIETKYLTFKPGEVAAVEMINETPFFEHFAASIRHTDTPTGSLATYRFQFTARPRYLRWILHPVMRCVLEFETKKRLRALSNFLTKQ
jgi:hypothetical protein